MKTKIVKWLYLILPVAAIVFISAVSHASVGELIKLEASATKVKFNDPLTLSWTMDANLLSGGMKCYDWDGELITEATGSKTIEHIRHQNRFQIGCSMITETAVNTIATAHASNMIEIQIDTSEPVVLSETPSFDSSKTDDDVTLEIKMGNKTYKIGRQGTIGNSQYKYSYIDTPYTTGTISWKYNGDTFRDCRFGSNELGNYVRENVWEEYEIPSFVPGYTNTTKTKRMKTQGETTFDLTKYTSITMTCFNSEPIVYKQKTANMQVLFYNIEGGSDAPSETPSTDLSKSSDPLKLTMKVGDKTYKVSGKGFDYTYDTANQVMTKDNMGTIEVFTKGKTGTLEWEADSSIFKYCQSDGQEMNNWPLGDLSTSGKKDIKIGAGTNLYQITCTSGDKSSLYTGESKMARVYISTSETNGLTIISDEDGKQIVVDEDEKKEEIADKEDESDDESSLKDKDDEITNGEWIDYSSMLDMPKVTADSGTPKCTEVPEEKFHGCYYKGKIDDKVDFPDQSTVLGGEMVLGNRIDHDWGTEKIITGLDGVTYTDNVSAIWRGEFYFGEGDYLFKATADDGVKVILDDTDNLIYKWYPQPRNTHISDLTHLSAGYHTVTVRYYEEGHKAAVKVWWEHQKPAIEAEELSRQLSIFEQLIDQLKDLVQKVLNFFGIE